MPGLPLAAGLFWLVCLAPANCPHGSADDCFFACCSTISHRYEKHIAEEELDKLASEQEKAGKKAALQQTVDAAEAAGAPQPEAAAPMES